MGTSNKQRRGRKARPHREQQATGTNGVPAAAEVGTPEAKDALEHATSVLGGALSAGYAGARSIATTLAPDAMAAALLVCMPDEWTTDDEALSLVHKLSNDEAAIVLAWLATQWRDGYSAGIADLRAGRTPLTELAS